MLPVAATPQAMSVGAAVASAVASLGYETTLPANATTGKSPTLAAFLSFLIVGSGQLYNGQPVKGILMFISCVLLWCVLLGWIVNIWSILDAYKTAEKINARCTA